MTTLNVIEKENSREAFSGTFGNSGPTVSKCKHIIFLEGTLLRSRCGPFIVVEAIYKISLLTILIENFKLKIITRETFVATDIQ